MLGELIKKAQKGDNDSFTELIKLFQQDLYKIAIAKLSNDSDAADVVQETIISAYKSIHKLRNCSYFKTWLLKILINKCNTIYKKRSKIQNISFDADEYDKYTYTEDISESNIEFYSMINILNNEERLIVILYYLEKYSTKEISKILKINHSTVRSKLLRAKQKISKNIKEENKNGGY